MKSFYLARISKGAAKKAACMETEFYMLGMSAYAISDFYRATKK